MTDLRSAGPVLVLGGTGFLGSEIVAELVRHGVAVRALARTPRAGRTAQALQGAEVVFGDASDPTVLAHALHDVVHVVDALGAAYPAESALAPTADVMGTLPTLIGLLEAMSRRPGIPVTFLSSGGTVYGEPQALPVPESAPCDPTTSYGITRLAAEKYVGLYTSQHGVPSRILRVANAYGPGQQVGRGQGAIAAFLDAALHGRPVRLFGDGSTLRDYVHVTDVARAVHGLLDRPEEHLVVNVGSGTGHTLVEVLDHVRAATGVDLAVEHLAPRAFDVRRIVLDCSHLSALIPWEPIGLAEGIGQTWAGKLADAPAPAATSAGRVL